MEKRNEHTKKNCAPSWLYLQDYTRMHGQKKNIKKVVRGDLHRIEDFLAEHGQQFSIVGN